jgi:hypothetical protein
MSFAQISPIIYVIFFFGLSSNIWNSGQEKPSGNIDQNYESKQNKNDLPASSVVYFFELPSGEGTQDLFKAAKFRVN